MINRRTFQNRPLSNEEIMQIAPSVFATQPWHAQSERYAFVPTSVVVDGMRNAGFEPYSVRQAGTRIEGKREFTKHIIRFRPVNNTLTVVGDTAVEAAVTNSHDGTSQYELGLGAFRLACLNGLMVSEGIADIVKIRHTGNIIQDVIEATQRILEHAPRVSEAIQLWKTIDLAPSEARILAEEAHSLRFEEGTVSPSAERLLQPRRQSDTGTDLWTTFNRVQENTVEGGLRTFAAITGRRSRTRAVTGIAENSKLNRALWSLAAKMAEIKTGVTA
jgi:Domain of unknown function (DUF932)